jgi:serine/threonine-protein kinase
MKKSAKAKRTVGQYELEETLGSGAAGTVYRATDPVLDRSVALKMLHPDQAAKDQVAERFLREAQIAGRVGSTHVVDTFDCGVTAKGEVYIVMEYLDGQDLGRYLRTQTPLAATESVEIATQILLGLESVHDAGVIHRDLKPGNVFLVSMRSPRWLVKLLDFGVGKAPTPALRPLTAPGALVGTPSYMAPEQHLGPAAVDGRADLYSVAVILFEMLSGRLPYEAITYAELAIKMMTYDAPLLREVAPSVPASIARVVDIGVARDPVARWQSARDFREALEDAARRAERQRTNTPLPFIEDLEGGAPGADPISLLER